MKNEQEKEVNKRVLFKMEQLKESLLNNSKWDRARAFNPSASLSTIEKYAAMSCIKKELAEIVDKEIRMGVPNLGEKDKMIFHEWKEEKIQDFSRNFGARLRGTSIREEVIIRWLVNAFESMPRDVKKHSKN